MSLHRYTHPLQNDVSIWMKNSRVARKSETNKNCKMGNAEIHISLHRYTYPLQNDVSIWMKNSRVGRKSETNKNCKMGNAEILIKLNFFFRILALNLMTWFTRSRLYWYYILFQFLSILGYRSNQHLLLIHYTSTKYIWSENHDIFYLHMYTWAVVPAPSSSSVSW